MLDNNLVATMKQDLPVTLNVLGQYVRNSSKDICLLSFGNPNNKQNVLIANLSGMPTHGYDALKGGVNVSLTGHAQSPMKAARNPVVQPDLDGNHVTAQLLHSEIQMQPFKAEAMTETVVMYPDSSSAPELNDKPYATGTHVSSTGHVAAHEEATVVESINSKNAIALLHQPSSYCRIFREPDGKQLMGCVCSFCPLFAFSQMKAGLGKIPIQSER